MLNKSIVQGRLTAAPELRTTPSGVSVVAFTVASQRDYAKAGEDRITDWIDVVAWRSTAEFINKYFGKGDLILVVGKLTTRNYEDKSGNKRKATEIVAEEVYFSEGKSERTQPSEPPVYEEIVVDTKKGPLPF